MYYWSRSGSGGSNLGCRRGQNTSAFWKWLCGHVGFGKKELGTAAGLSLLITVAIFLSLSLSLSSSPVLLSPSLSQDRVLDVYLSSSLLLLSGTHGPGCPLRPLLGEGRAGRGSIKGLASMTTCRRGRAQGRGGARVAVGLGGAEAKP